ncbi:MAG TPA: transporter substrate-binding domain-containing protein [Candidatus Limnocylindrales bacterium]|nr:transporter substrate-binding domain-containing protein [Candidatus Limnocylindrales bacterium]
MARRLRPGLFWRVLAIGAVTIILAGCSGSSATPASANGDPTKDKLAQVEARGTLVLWTDPDYAPQSMAVKGATRLASTKCAPNQMTAPEMTGYDAETGKLVAAELGLEPCFVTAPWDQVIAGNWGDQWDVAWGSGALEASRMSALYVTQPYYTTPANFFVLASSPYQKPADLDGKQIGACSGCTHQQYLQGTLTLPGESLSPLVSNPKLVTYASEIPGLADVAAGKIDAFLCSQPVGAGAIKTGSPLRMLDQVAFYTYKTGYVDRGLTLSPAAFLDKINGAIHDLEANGKLKALSIQFFGIDYVTAAATFDLASVGQKVP